MSRLCYQGLSSGAWTQSWCQGQGLELFLAAVSSGNSVGACATETQERLLLGCGVESEGRGSD